MDDAAANTLLDARFGAGRAAGTPATDYLALFRDDSYAEELTTTGGIDRFPIPNDATSWPDASAGEKVLTLAAPIESDPSTGVWANDATAWALMSAATGGDRGPGGTCDPISNDVVGTVIPINDGDLTVEIPTD